MTWPTTSRHERGYGSRWTKTRLRILQRDCYMCQCADCKREDRVCIADEVDHIVSKADWLKRHGSLDGVDAESNLQAIAHDCHVIKTMRETGKTPRATTGVDGWSRT